LWYSFLDERMNFDRGHDTLDDYQIPISEDEYHKMTVTTSDELCGDFLAGRRARVIHEGGVTEISSDYALSRRGRTP
jgi:hypothetical protein